MTDIKKGKLSTALPLLNQYTNIDILFSKAKTIAHLSHYNIHIINKKIYRDIDKR